MGDPERFEHHDRHHADDSCAAAVAPSPVASAPTPGNGAVAAPPLRKKGQVTTTRKTRRILPDPAVDAPRSRLGSCCGPLRARRRHVHDGPAFHVDDEQREDGTGVSSAALDVLTELDGI